MRDLTAVLIPHLSASFVGSLLIIGPVWTGGVVFGGVVGADVELPIGPKITGFG